MFFSFLPQLSTFLIKKICTIYKTLSLPNDAWGEVGVGGCSFALFCFVFLALGHKIRSGHICLHWSAFPCLGF